MKRLDTIFSLIPESSTFADIGCDHGKLLKMVLDEGKAENAIGADISKPSLIKAQTLLSGYKNVQFFVSDGFKQIPNTIDTAVVSGMGGKIINSILIDCTIKTIIVQPQKNVDCVREFLASIGYNITKDVVAFENKKFYDVLLAEYANREVKLTQEQLSYGVFYKEKNELRLERLLYLKNKCVSYKQTDEVKEKLKGIEEALLWQQ